LSTPWHGGPIRNGSFKVEFYPGPYALGSRTLKKSPPSKAHLEDFVRRKWGLPGFFFIFLLKKSFFYFNIYLHGRAK
jgi:hypothetical protein